MERSLEISCEGEGGEWGVVLSKRIMLKKKERKKEKKERKRRKRREKEREERKRRLKKERED